MNGFLRLLLALWTGLFLVISCVPFEKMVGTKVFLELFVKVKAGWRDSRNFVEELDWRRQLQQIGGVVDPEA